MQSTNEEITTLNQELQSRNAELGQLNDDLTNHLASVNILMLGTDFKIRPMANGFRFQTVRSTRSAP